MKDGLLDALEKGGYDVAGGRRRMLNNDALYLRLLKCFVEQDEAEHVVLYIREGDCTSAFNVAHSLKGSAGSLGLTALYNAATEITELLRSGDLQGASVMLPRLITANESFLTVYRLFE